MCEHTWISHHGLLVCHPRLVKLHMGSSLRINGGYYAWSTSQLLWCLYGLKRVVSILNCLITSWNSLLPSNLPLFVTQMRVQSLCITSTWPNISMVFLSSSLMSHLCQTIIRLYISQNFLKDFRPAHSQSAWPFEAVIGNIQDTPSNWHLGMY